MGAGAPAAVGDGGDVAFAERGEGCWWASAPPALAECEKEWPDCSRRLRRLVRMGTVIAGPLRPQGKLGHQLVRSYSLDASCNSVCTREIESEYVCVCVSVCV